MGGVRGGWNGDLLRVCEGYRSSSSCTDAAGYDFLFDGDQELEVNISLSGWKAGQAF
jgi:hypothetical protein